MLTCHVSPCCYHKIPTPCEWTGLIFSSDLYSTLYVGFLEVCPAALPVRSSLHSHALSGSPVPPCSASLLWGCLSRSLVLVTAVFLHHPRVDARVLMFKVVPEAPDDPRAAVDVVPVHRAEDHVQRLHLLQPLPGATVGTEPPGSTVPATGSQHRHHPADTD